MTVTINGGAPSAQQQQDLRKAFGLAPDPIGLDRPARFAFAGDSIARQWSVRHGASPLWWAATELYPCEYDTVLISGVGGTSSSHLIDTQIAQLEALAIKPDVVIVQTLQNDFIGTKLNADTFFAYVQQYSERAISAGVKLVVLCSRPPKSSADTPSAVYYLNRKIEQYCRATPGNFYCDVFSAWRRTNAADTSGVQWRGTNGGADSFSDDGTHPIAAACRAAAPLIVPVLERFARPITPMAQAAVAYDNVNWPYNNVLGPNGLMLGTSGQYNGVDNAGVAGNSTGPRDRWFLTDGSGITATPSIVTGPDGYLYQQLVLSGTATAAATVRLRTTYLNDVATGNFVAEAIIKTQNLTGVRGIEFAVAGFTAPGFYGGTNSQMNIGTTNFHIRTETTTHSNSGFSAKDNEIRIHVNNGATVSGSVLVGRVGIFRLS